MKKLVLFLLLFISLTQPLFSQTSSRTGAWNSTATWSTGSIPGSSDDVTIASGDIVTVSSTQSCKTITIENGATLKIVTGAALSTSSTVIVNGTLTMEAGTFNVGSSKTKYLKISGGTFNFSGGTINVAGRYAQLSGGDAYLSGNALLNVGTLPGQKNKTIHIFSVTTNGTFSVASGATAKVVLKNGNSGDASEVYYSPKHSDFSGGSFVIENNSSVPDVYLDSDVPMYDLISDVGAGNMLHFAPGCDFQMHDFTIQSGKTCVDAGARVDINGTASLNSDGNLILKVDSSAAASVLFSQAPAEKVGADIYLSKAEFHYISTPVSESQTFSDLNMGLTAGVGNDSFYYWDEALDYDGVTGNWVDILNGPDGTGAASEMSTANFQTAKGYAIRYQDASHTLSLTGSAMETDQTIAATRTSGSTGEGWTLVGNPFTASIAANRSAGNNNFIKVNADILDPVYSGIYFWDEQPSYHGHRNDNLPVSNASSGKYIPPGQAFMVRVKTSGNLIFPVDLQNNGGKATFYKDTVADHWTRCWFGLSGNNDKTAETMIAFGEGMTPGLDVSYDVGAIKRDSQPDLFTRLVSDVGYDFAIQALPPLDKPQAVRVGVDADSSGNYILSFIRSENLSDSVTVFLQDTKTEAMIDFRKEGTYAFSVETPGRIPDRFVLYFNQKTTGTSSLPATDPASVNIKVIQHLLMVKNLTDKPLHCSLKILNLMGQDLFHQDLDLADGDIYERMIPDVKGLAIISVSNDSFVKTQKVIF